MADINRAFVYEEPRKKKKSKKAKMSFEEPQEKKPKKPKKSRKKSVVVEKTNDVCRFFLVGETCRFGDKCRNLHVTDGLSSEGVDQEAINVIFQYLANFGMVATKAKEFVELKKENQRLKEEIEKNKDTVPCRVCFENFALSKLCALPCGHVYCKECYKRFPREVPGLRSVGFFQTLVACPTCNQRTGAAVNLF